MSDEVLEAAAHEMYDIDVDRPIASPGRIDVYRPWMRRVLRAALEAAEDKAQDSPFRIEQAMMTELLDAAGMKVTWGGDRLLQPVERHAANLSEGEGDDG